MADFDRASRGVEKSVRGIIGSFMELADVDQPYLTGLGTFVVSESEGQKSLFLRHNGKTTQVATVLAGGAVYSPADGRAGTRVAQALTRWVGKFLTEAETVTAQAFLAEWAQRVTETLDAGEVFTYEAEQGGQTQTARFVVMENGYGQKEISVRVPFLAPPASDPGEGSLFPFSRVESRQARILFRFLNNARPASPPALVAAFVERPDQSL